MSSNRILVSKASRIEFNTDLLVLKANEVLVSFGYKSGIELSFMLMGKKRALELNKSYRQKDYIPQMLEFPMSKKADADGIIRLGDIVICVPLFKKEMVVFGKSEETVLDEWLAHGIGNLLQ